MKTSTVKTLSRYFESIDVSSDADLIQAVEDVRTEAAKLYAEAHAKQVMYEQAKAAVMRALTDEPQTCAEIFNKCYENLPAGFTRNNLSYAFGHYWADDVVVTRDKVNMYAKA